MTTTKNLLEIKASLKFYEKLYIKREYNGVYETEWLDITNYLLFASVDNIENKLDFDEYGYGEIKTANASFTVDNKDGAFNRAGFIYSLWRDSDKRHYTKIKYEAGYYDTDDTKIVETIFEGLLNEKTFKTDFNTGKSSFESLAYSQVFAEGSFEDIPITDVTTLTTSAGITEADQSRIYVNSLAPISVGDYVLVGEEETEFQIKDIDTDDSGDFIRISESLVNTLTAGSVIVKQNYTSSISSLTGYIFENDFVSKYLTYDNSLIAPYFDYTIDNAKYYNGMSYNEILTDVCQKSSSVWYIDDDYKLNIRDKTVNSSLAEFEFIGGSTQNRKNNVLNNGITIFDDGYNKIINQVTWENDYFNVLDKDDASNLEKYGTTDFELSGNDVTNETTAKSITGIIIEQNGVPKKRLGIKTVYMPNVIDFFQPCTVDYKPNVKNLPANLSPLVWNANTYINSTWYWSVYENQLIINDFDDWKYYGYTHDVASGTTEHYLIES